MSGAVACKQTRKGDDLPQDSIGTSIKLFGLIIIKLNFDILKFRGKG
jgi:hypothetical protein